MQRVIITGNPYVWKYADAIRSLPALDAEYGDRGSRGSVSSDEPISTEP